MTPRVFRAFLLALVLLSGTAIVGTRSTRPVSASGIIAVPSGLPPHLGIGLAAHPDATGLYGWMPASRIPWDYAYQYLSGGVNTGGGWETWNADGQFALSYAQGAAADHAIPVFTYYEINQSHGPCDLGCGEAQKDLTNLNTPATMAAYFGNFALLMQRLGAGTYNGAAGFGGTAIVHVEPDLSGFAMQAVLNNGSCSGFCSGQGTDPSLLHASVASSGYAAVGSYPDTYQGFNLALLHLRDLYAPAVKLAFHISNWAAGTDIGSNTAASLDPTALGQQVGAFAAASGAAALRADTSAYDLLFNDVLDRDAGYYKYVYGASNVWWDRTNTVFPNFHRWEAYVSAASAAANRSVIVWQVPLGNQYEQTMNNTDGHYQDNRVEYFMAHPDELVQAGVIAVLYGSGNGGSTVNNDGKKDGVTNPASICTSDGMDGGQICANHASTSTDDDGGYLRMMATQYYTGGALALGGSSLPGPTPVASATAAAIVAATAPSIPSPTVTPPASAAPSVTVHGSIAPVEVVAGDTTQLNAVVESNQALSEALVDVEVYDAAGAKIYQTDRTLSAPQAGTGQTVSIAWTVPITTTPGRYTLKIGVFGAGWSPLYTWNNAAGDVTVDAPAPAPAATSTPSVKDAQGVLSTPVAAATPLPAQAVHAPASPGGSTPTAAASPTAAAARFPRTRPHVLSPVTARRQPRVRDALPLPLVVRTRGRVDGQDQVVVRLTTPTTYLHLVVAVAKRGTLTYAGQTVNAPSSAFVLSHRVTRDQIVYTYDLAPGASILAPGGLVLTAFVAGGTTHRHVADDIYHLTTATALTRGLAAGRVQP